MEFADLEASFRITLDDGTVLTRCDQCREMWRERNKRGIEGEPPCESCKVILQEENQEAAEIYMMTRGQIISAEIGGGELAVYLSIPAVESAMRIRGVKDQWECLGRVQRLFSHFDGKRRTDAS